MLFLGESGKEIVLCAMGTKEGEVGPNTPGDETTLLRSQKGFRGV